MTEAENQNSSAAENAEAQQEQNVEEQTRPTKEDISSYEGRLRDLRKGAVRQRSQQLVPGKSSDRLITRFAVSSTMEA